MSKVATHVTLDDEVLQRIDDWASQTGSSRDQVIEDSLRRDLASRMLQQVFNRAKAGPLSQVDAEELAYRELGAARSKRLDTSG